MKNCISDKTRRRKQALVTEYIFKIITEIINCRNEEAEKYNQKKSENKESKLTFNETEERKKKHDYVNLHKKIKEFAGT